MGEPTRDEFTPRDRRIAELVAQMVMARLLTAVCSPEVAERLAATWAAGARTLRPRSGRGPRRGPRRGSPTGVARARRVATASAGSEQKREVSAGPSSCAG